jgi:non-ribosomal peptide synthetase component F
MERQVAKFQVQDILPIGLTIVVTGIGLAYGLDVMGDVKADMTVASAEYNATGDAITGVAKLPEKLPLIVNVIVAAIIIGILVRYLMVRFG